MKFPIIKSLMYIVLILLIIYLLPFLIILWIFGVNFQFKNFKTAFSEILSDYKKM